MNVKFAVGAASAIAMVVLLIAKRFNHLVDDFNQVATVKCAVPAKVVDRNAQAEQELEAFTHQRDRLVVVMFYSNWCFPSIDTKPLVESVAREFGDGAAVRCIDVDRAGSLLAAYQVEHVPEVRFFRNGEQIGAHIGAATIEELRAKFEKPSGTGETAPKPRTSAAASVRALFTQPAKSEPASTPQSSGHGTFEPMKKGWMPAGMEKR